VTRDDAALWAVASRASGALTRTVRDQIDGVSMNQVRSILLRLERDGLISRDPYVYWKRKVLWNATERGRRLAIQRRNAERTGKLWPKGENYEG
jgi:DNA-binding HxlR family transcriptional regulator